MDWTVRSTDHGSERDLSDFVDAVRRDFDSSDESASTYCASECSSSDLEEQSISSKRQDLTNYLSSTTTPRIEEGPEAKGQSLGGFDDDDDISEEPQWRCLSYVRHQLLSLYRRLFGIVFVVNMGVFISYAIRGAVAKQIGTVVVGNLFTAVVMRQEYVINAFFTVGCLAPRSWPLAIRRTLAHIYSIGGIHSGAAVSGTVWSALFVGKATREVMSDGKTGLPTLVVSYTILALLVIILVFAYPKFRTRHHDVFEMVHRFAGWAAVALVWAQVVLLTNDYRTPDEPLGHALAHSATFWLVAVLTSSIVLSWLRLRKVPVRVEALSDHCVRFYFNYVDTKPGHFTRMSTNPLLEWHSFATITEPGKTGYSSIISRAGDWTSKQIENPPDKIWVRGIPCYGVVSVTPLFRRVVMVATGSGIGPVAPVIFAKRTEIQLLWVAPSVRQTFGDKLVDSLLNASPGSVIYDTRTHACRPDLIQLTYRMVRDFQAEAVVIISNRSLTEKVVYGMESRGIPAYGAIWDS